MEGCFPHFVGGNHSDPSCPVPLTGESWLILAISCDAETLTVLSESGPVAGVRGFVQKLVEPILNSNHSKLIPEEDKFLSFTGLLNHF